VSSALIEEALADDRINPCRPARRVSRSVLLGRGHLHAAVQRHRHIAVAGADGQAQLFKLLGFWFMAQQGADDVQRFPRMGVVVLGMLAQPAGGFLFERERGNIALDVRRRNLIEFLLAPVFNGDNLVYLRIGL